MQPAILTKNQPAVIDCGPTIIPHSRRFVNRQNAQTLGQKFVQNREFFGGMYENIPRISTGDFFS